MGKAIGYWFVGCFASAFIGLSAVDLLFRDQPPWWRPPVRWASRLRHIAELPDPAIPFGPNLSYLQVTDAGLG